MEDAARTYARSRLVTGPLANPDLFRDEPVNAPGNAIISPLEAVPLTKWETRLGGRVIRALRAFRYVGRDLQSLPARGRKG